MNAEVTAIVLTTDGKKVIAGYGRDQEKAGDSIKVWDIDTGSNILSFNNGGETMALAVTPDGKHLLSGDWGQDRVNVWEIKSGKLVKSYPTGGTSAIAVSARGSYALFGGYMNFRLVELVTGKEIRQINKGIRDWVKSIKFSPDGRYALVGDQVPQPKLWDLSSGELLKTFGGYAGGTITARTVGTNMLMTAHGYSNSASLWDYKNGVQLKIIKNDTNCLSTSASISDDGTRVAFGGYDMTAGNTYVSVWSAETSEKIVKIYPPSRMSSHPKSPLFSKDGKKIFWASGAKVIISNAKDGSMITTLDPGV
jgi:WD40 repeat protein